MDVVLSMRALHSSMSPKAETFNSVGSGGIARLEGGISPTQSQFTEGSRSSPTSSLSRSQSVGTTGNSATSMSDNSSVVNASNSGTLTPPPRPSLSATTAIKSLFTIGGGRPRSPSASTSVSGLSGTSSPVPDDDIAAYPEDSFTHAGTSLMGLLHSNGHEPDGVISIEPSTPRAGTPVISADTHPVFLERKILPDSDRQMVENESIAMVKGASSRRGSIVAPMDNVLIIPQRINSDGMNSPALQPPPRKRAGTVNAVAPSISSPTELEPYTYAHTNRSTAESLGVQNPHLLSPSPPMPVMNLPNSARLKDRRARASWSSVSTYGSNDQSPSSPDDSRSRRWSRRSSLPQRMSPPYPPPGSPPSSPKLHNLRMPTTRHPYAVDTSPLSRSSSVGSSQSRMSELQSRSFSAKRASASSAYSIGTGTSPPALGSAVAGGLAKFTSRPRSAHRASMPPPQRPPPISALPPTPGENSLDASVVVEEAHSAPPTKPSFRESLKLRPKRHSATPPSLPPSGSLPPRPDELVFRPSHRRSSSYGNVSNASTPLGSIPASPTLFRPAFPLNGPLPPTPSSATASTATSSRHSSITRRFRRTSSPVTSNTPQSEPASPEPYPSSFLPSVLAPPSPILETPVHALPIGEPITTSQNDPNFLNLSPPTPPGSDLSVDARLPDITPGPTALSPPPRRASRHAPLSVSDESRSNADMKTRESGYASTSEADVSSDSDPTIVRPPPDIDDFAPMGVAI